MKRLLSFSVGILNIWDFWRGFPTQKSFSGRGFDPRPAPVITCSFLFQKQMSLAASLRRIKVF